MRPIDVVRKVCHNCRQEYLTAFENGDGLFLAAGINNRLRLAAFISQFYAETGGGTVTMENMNYSAQRMLEIFGQGHHSDPVSPAEAAALEHKPEQIAERVYGYKTKIGRDLGNTQPGDGYKYRGGGIMQTTGRGNYARTGKKCGVDFENHPELVLSAEHALKPALVEWQEGHCNTFADEGDVMSVSRIINLGNPHTNKIPNGWGDRQLGYKLALQAIGSEPIVLNPSKGGPVIAPQPTPAPVPKLTPASVKHGTAAGTVVVATAAAKKAADSGAPTWMIVAIVVAGLAIAAGLWFWLHKRS